MYNTLIYVCMCECACVCLCAYMYVCNRGLATRHSRFSQLYGYVRNASDPLLVHIPCNAWRVWRHPKPEVLCGGMFSKLQHSVLIYFRHWTHTIVCIIRCTRYASWKTCYWSFHPLKCSYRLAIELRHQHDDMELLCDEWNARGRGIKKKGWWPARQYISKPIGQHGDSLYWTGPHCAFLGST